MPFSSTDPRDRLVARIDHARPVPEADPRSILSSIGEVVYDWDLASDTLVWGPNARDVLGRTGLSDLRSGFGWAKQVTPDSPTSRYDAILKSGERDAGAGVRYQLEYGMLPLARGVAPVWVEDTGRWFAATDGRPARAHGVIRTMAARPTEHPGLPPHAARLDPLTGALTRAALIAHLDKIYTSHGRARAQFAVLLTCIDNLVWLNRSNGYDAADEVIAGVGARLRGNLRAIDVIGRYAGNKFVLVLDSCDAGQMAAAAQRCTANVQSKPYTTSAGDLSVQLKVGGIIAPRQARNHQALLQQVEEALESARAPGGPAFVAYTPSLGRDATRQRTRRVSAQIVSALNDNRIEIALEPIVCARTREPVLHEALLRMRLEDGTIAPPSAVIPTAEETGLVSMIDYRVLDLALTRLQSDPNLKVSVNMSGATVRDPDWANRVAALVRVRAGVATRLTVEITETCAIENLDVTQACIAHLRSLGLKIAMDDFGAGHTSFRNLRALGIDMVKIDGAFIQNLTHSVDDRFFVRTLVELAAHLKIPVVAEWVEDEETARLLAGWGVDYFQGSLFERAEISDVAAPRAETQAA